MITRRKIIFISPLGALVGCGIVVISKSPPDGTQVMAGQGVLAVQFSADSFGSIAFKPYGELTFGARVTEDMFNAEQRSLWFINGQQFLILPVNAGEYMWTRIAISGQYGWIEPPGALRFRVQPNTITYIGNIKISVFNHKATISIFDQEIAMREYLGTNFPLYSKNLPFQKLIAQDYRLHQENSRPFFGGSKL